MGIIRMGDCYTSTQIVMTGVAMSMGVLNYAPQSGPGSGLIAREALINIETGDVRYHVCGATPAVACGMAVVAGDYLVLNSPNDIQKFKVVMTGSTTATAVVFLSF